MSQQELLSYLVKVLNENHIEYMVTGSTVSSFQGQPRMTHDIDVLVNIKKHSIPGLMKAFSMPEFYLDESSIVEAIRLQRVFNVLETSEGDKIDFWILKEDPFDRSRFKRKYEEDLLGTTAFISTPEDTILAKLNWAKESGGSEKQIGDARSIYEISHSQLDLDYIQSWVYKLQLDAEWTKLKSQASI